MATISHSDLEALWTLAGGTQATADVAAAIAEAESGGNPSAIANTAYPNLPGYHPPPPGAQPEYSVGLWQINLLAHPQYTASQMLTPRLNAIAAYAISNGGTDFSPWTTYTHDLYKSHLQSAGTPTAQAGVVTGLATGWIAPSAHSGYADFRNSVEKHVPRQLVHARTIDLLTLRRLKKLSSVRK